MARRPNRPRTETDPEEFRATLGEHLDELRSRVLRVLGVLVVASTLGWFLAMPAFRALSEVVAANIPKGIEFKEPFRTITEPFMLQLKLAVYIGLCAAIPWLVAEVWQFVKPGLRPHERRPVKILAPFSVALFGVGCWVGWLMIPPSFQWFATFFQSFPGTALYQEPGTMVFLIVKLVLAFGIGFQLPVVTFLLAKLGLITPATLNQYWRQAVVAIFVLASVLTPSGDPFTMLAMAVPLCVLFFGAVLAVKWTTKDGGRDPALDNLD